MRYVNGVLALMMIAFIAVQYNDPDGPFWMAIYLVPAVCAGLTALRPDLLRRSAGRFGLLGCLVLAVIATIVFWPTDAFWWRRDVWWESEAAREGMGLMIATTVIAVATFTVLLGNRAGRQSDETG